MSSGSGDIREKRKVEKQGVRVFLLLTVPMYLFFILLTQNRELVMPSNETKTRYK